MKKIEPNIRNIEDFNKFSSDFQSQNQMPFSFGICKIFKDSKGDLIAVKWLTQNFKESLGSASVLMNELEIDLTKEESDVIFKEIPDGLSNSMIHKYFNVFKEFEKFDKKHTNVNALLSALSGDKLGVIFYKDEETLAQKEIVCIPDAHYRLALISSLKYKPNTLCLDKLFPTLPILAYTKKEVFSIDDWNEKHSDKQPDLVDKFPLYFWGRSIPEGVRMPNPYSARLGAYLSLGTTIMPYGYVNFNAGTFGKAMIEGTLAAGCTIDEGTDIGKGGGFLGTLSGGNTKKLSAGKNCLIGALAECGIVLGDNCIVSTGVCFTENTPFIEILPDGGERVVKALEFHGKSDMLYRRNSISGSLEAINQKNDFELNPELHAEKETKKEISDGDSVVNP